VIAGATLLGAAVLAGAASGGLIAANPTLRAALGLGWMLGLWASFAVFLTFLTAWLIEELDEEPEAAVREEEKPHLTVVPVRVSDAESKPQAVGAVARAG
jgi:hypothetical protein